MMYPPVNELLDKVDCRYTLVVEVSKRARQLVEGAPKMTDFKSDRPVSIAVHEIYEGKVRCDRTVDGQ